MAQKGHTKDKNNNQPPTLLGAWWLEIEYASDSLVRNPGPTQFLDAQ